MATVREEWLSLTKEDPLDPDVPISDAHHHFLAEDEYSLEAFLRDLAGGHNVVSTVHVEAGPANYRAGGPEELKPVGETEFIVSQIGRQRSRTDVAAGIVGFADLARGAAVMPVLEAHMSASDQRFRGIRQATWSDAATPLSDARFREGFACLQRYDLSFDAWVFHTQLAGVAELAAAFPGTTIILNHLGGPLTVGPYFGKREAVFEEWKPAIARLADYPNVVVKLGGLGMPVFGFPWRKAAAPPSSVELAAAMAPYFLWCIDRFGAERCMFESNFPADKVSYSYTVMWNACKLVVRHLPATDRAALFHDTAVRVYRLRSGT